MNCESRHASAVMTLVTLLSLATAPAIGCGVIDLVVEAQLHQAPHFFVPTAVW